MPTVYFISWGTSGVTNADFSMNIETYDGTRMFGSLIRADQSNFFYTAPANFWSRSSGLLTERIKLYSNTAWKNGDSSPTINLYSIRAEEQEFGQVHVSTNFGTTILKFDSSVYTNSIVFIDRTSKAVSDSTIFFTAASTSLLYPNRVIDPEYSYQDPSFYAKLGRTVPDPTGIFRVYRDSTVPIVGAVDGTLHIDITYASNKILNSVYIYMDHTLADSVGSYYIGEVTSKLIDENGNRLSFALPDQLTKVMGETNFLNSTVYFRHDGIYVSGELIDDQSTEEYYLYDTYLTAQATVQDSVHSINSATVADSTIPIEASVVSVLNHARIHKGNSYVFDYYTPGKFYNWSGEIYFSYRDWNLFEVALNNIGRYYHTPLIFGEELPEFCTIKVCADCTAHNVYTVEDYLQTSPAISKTATGFKIIPEVSQHLRLYNANITPSVVHSDGTTFRLVPHIMDTTICINVFRYSNKKFYPWSSPSAWHPFSSDTNLSLTFFGKK